MTENGSARFNLFVACEYNRLSSLFATSAWNFCCWGADVSSAKHPLWQGARADSCIRNLIQIVFLSNSRGQMGFYIHSMVLDILLHDSENHLSIRQPSLCILAAHESDCLSYTVTRQIIIYDVMEDVYSYVRPLYTPISIKVALGFGHWNAEYNAMLCLSDHQTMNFQDQSTIPKAIIFIGVHMYVLNLNRKRKNLFPDHETVIFVSIYKQHSQLT